MRIENERDRQAATQVLKEVKNKLEEAWRLARDMEDHEKTEERRCRTSIHG